MNAQTLDFVEKMGLALESDGFPRIAGRIFGLLLLSEDCRSLDDLAAELGVSKGSVSTNARLLELRGVLERNSRPSDRRDYYRVPPDLFSQTMAQRLARWQRLDEAIAEARATLPIRSQKVLHRLDEYQAAYAFISEVIHEGLTRWQDKREHQAAAAGQHR